MHRRSSSPASMSPIDSVIRLCHLLDLVHISSHFLVAPAATVAFAQDHATVIAVVPSLSMLVDLLDLVGNTTDFLGFQSCHALREITIDDDGAVFATLPVSSTQTCSFPTRLHISLTKCWSCEVRMLKPSKQHRVGRIFNLGLAGRLKTHCD